MMVQRDEDTLPGAEVENKIAVNEAKYPVERARGSAKKYTEL